MTKFTLAVTLTERERVVLLGTVRVMEAVRLGLNPAAFSPAEQLPGEARELARRAEAALRQRDLRDLRGAPLVLCVVSAALLLGMAGSFPPGSTRILRGVVGKLVWQWHLQQAGTGVP